MSEAQLSFRKSANIDRVTDKRKDSLFRLVDTDGSGTIDAQEFAVLYDAIKKDLAEELEKEAELQKEASSARRRFKMLLLFVAVLVSFLAASVAANFAVIFTVVDEAITTTTTSSGFLEVKGSDMIAKTAEATQDVPLVAAPVLDMDDLSNVKSLKVSYTHLGSNIQARMAIVAVRKHNATFVEFITDVPGETVEVRNGEARLVRYEAGTEGGSAPPRRFRICSANATCSALRATGIDVDEVMDKARAALEENGFDEAARRLDVTDPSSCIGGSWDYYSCTSSCSSATAAGYSVSAYYYLYHTGYYGLKHLVFMLHGAGGNKNSLWDQYCTPYTWACPIIHNSPYFKHLIFMFISSPLPGATWNTNNVNAYTYYDGADVLASVSCGVNPSWGWAFSQTTGNACPWAGTRPVETDGITSSSEMMFFGYSHGGGLAAYAVYSYPHNGLSKAVAIDYHPYHNDPVSAEYIGWSDFNGYSFDGAKISVYYSCASDWYWTEQITSGSTTFPAEMGMSGSPSHSTYAFNSASYDVWTWSGSNGRYFKFYVTGLSTSTLPGACSCGSGSGYPLFFGGCQSQTCGTTCSGSITHSQMPGKVSFEAELCDWVGGCTANDPPSPPPFSPSPPPPSPNPPSQSPPPPPPSPPPPSFASPAPPSPAPPPSSPSPSPPFPPSPVGTSWDPYICDPPKKGWCCPKGTECISPDGGEKKFCLDDKHDKKYKMIKWEDSCDKLKYWMPYYDRRAMPFGTTRQSLEKKAIDLNKYGQAFHNEAITDRVTIVNSAYPDKYTDRKDAKEQAKGSGVPEEEEEGRGGKGPKCQCDPKRTMQICEMQRKDYAMAKKLAQIECKCEIYELC